MLMFKDMKWQGGQKQGEDCRILQQLAVVIDKGLFEFQVVTCRATDNRHIAE